MNTKAWVKVFKAFGNEGRLKILQLLFDGKERTVSEIAKHIKISLKATSKHLIILDNLGFLESTGKNGRVFYTIDCKDIPSAKEMVRVSMK